MTQSAWAGSGWLGLAAALALMAGAAVAATPEAVIAERRAGYKHIDEIAKAMDTAVKAGADMAPYAGGLDEIVAWARRVPTLFPPGTEAGGGTRALPPVWQDRAGFDKLAADFLAEGLKAQKLLAGGDKAAFADQYKTLRGVCGECHRTYRAKL